MTSRLGRVMTYGDMKPTMEAHDLWLLSLVRSRKKIKTQYLVFCKFHSPQAWQSVSWGCRCPTHKTTWSLNYLVTRKIKKKKIKNCSVFNKNCNNRLLEGIIFCVFSPKIRKFFFSITIGGYIAMKILLMKKLYFSYVLCIFFLLFYYLSLNPQ